ncbi:putative disease resistance protein At4g11170 [Vicia villosa]|uniref:putative disease resistance protein At4g11170 n=1 Tax=Vicia villosa TaxID=3911 RepID=UPI00273B4532|nr:putative disease resistance protein At4g11170 [Vicia villosa]
MSSSITTYSKRKKTYDVYLSFSAKVPSTFVRKLHKALCTYVPRTRIFLDRTKLLSTNWETTPSESLLIIEKCKMVVILLSSIYMSSPSCLGELEKITECCLTTTDLVVLPVLYHFDQRFRGDMFRKAFHDFLDRIPIKKISPEEDNIMTWVEAITKSTQYPTDFIPTDRNECDCVKSVVERVIYALYKIRPALSSTFYTPSVKSGVQDVLQLLKQSKCPLVIGIWGIAGIGKTSIAKTIYDMIGPYFEGKCMLDNVSEVWERYTGPFSLQEELLFCVNNATGFEKETLKGNLQNKRVLLILDDVNKLEQLNSLCGSREWFGAGSKIIITTRDRHLLKEYGVDHIYTMKQLDQSESLEVFKWGAFGNETTLPEDFAELSRQVVAYSGGWPLALITLGRLLRGKEALQWKGVLWSLKNMSIPAPRLLNILEKSFNELSDNEKQTFLDIASFFIGKNQNDVLQTLNRSTQSPTLQVSLLQNKSLVTIDENNKLQMHVLLQAMARDIINRESRSRTIQPKMYDVFLSFRGEDSRAKFMSHLYSSLQDAGIYAFRDDDEIQHGDQISISLLRAIEQSRISIVVLTTNYANSRWCMLELERIIEISKANGLDVVPVFYEVDPSEVRHQEGQFGKAFEELRSTTSVNESTKTNWRRDLFDIGSKAGFVLKDSRNESEDVKNIVESVSRLLDRTELFVAEHPVGVESRVEATTKLLNIQKSEDVLILGIWGMGGMGKTTIAKAIYNQIGSKFEGKSFLLNIREIWETDTNQVSLQQQVLCDIYKTMTFKIRDIESGKNILKERLSQNRVLFVLDDVNEIDQINALCGSREWFGPGSRIIITTRDMHILNSCRVDHVHRIEVMDESESLELFSWHAFKQSSPTKDFATHSIDVIAYSGGLPLALQVLGSYLSDCEIPVWQKVLEKLKCIPNNEVHKKLKVSFDGLKDITEKQAFLDIVCFFIGMERNDVTQILNGCGYFADIGIKVLIERSLVTVDNRNKLQMHDLLRDMGRQIIYEESPFDLEKRSRLWRPEEVFDILSKYTGTKAVKGLALDFPTKNKVRIDTKAFKKMNKLRLLQLARVQLDGDFNNLSGELRWLYWHGFPSASIPVELQKGSLVALELKYSNLKYTWKCCQKMLENLKILNLSHSLELTETPNFSYMPNLEKIVLKDCPSLSSVSYTIGDLDKLLLINLTDCRGLGTLPRSIYDLKSLETLILSRCSMIDKLEEDLEHMKSLTTLIADKTAITQVPFSIVRSKSIKYISLPGFEGFSRDVFPSLILSWMSPSNNVVSLVQTAGSMSSIGLYVKCGSKLQLSQDVARILEALKATNCQKLEASASSTPVHISDIYPSSLINDYIGQASTSKSNNYLKSFLIQMGMKLHATNIVEDNILQTADGIWNRILLPCYNISDWSTFSSKGCSLIFDVPTMKGSNLKNMTLFVVYYSSSDNIASEGCQGVLIINYTKTTIQAYTKDALTSFEDEDWKSITSNLESGNNVEIMVVLREGFIVEKTTISLLYDEPVDKEMEHCNAIFEESVIAFSDDDKNVGVSGGDNIDVPMDDIVTSSEQDEALSDDKHGQAMSRKRK